MRLGGLAKDAVETTQQLFNVGQAGRAGSAPSSRWKPTKQTSQ